MCRALWSRLCRGRLLHGYVVFLGLLLFLQEARGSGYFELQVLEMSNPRSRLLDGGCCGGAGDASQCPRPCSTLFRVCLKEYQSSVTATGSCSFGNASSAVLGGSSFTLADPDSGADTIVLPFTFRWTKSFTLILQAVDLDNSTQPGRTRVIEEATFSGIIVPSSAWHTLNYDGNNSRITYRVRVQCDSHYFNLTCTKFCRPRDDKFGHYRCDVNGDKQCIDGWQGPNCESAVCKAGCHPIHGKCDHPGGCECRPGWQGEYCDQCMPYPGCKHGYCNGSSWQCICDTNWGGILCDQDLNTCGTLDPCQNGGTCENTAPDQYRCTCPEGFSGLNCEVVDNPCATEPCANGGTCQESASGQVNCTCAPGWTGPTCLVNIDECASAPCQNSGTCVDQVNSFMCLCPPGWEGDACQFDADECQQDPDPCKNAVSCHNVVGSYRCKCRKGWEGQNCDLNINDCVGQCQHGATCIDLVNDYHCACQPGFTGRDCHTNINECESNPCKNGGECSDQVNGYRCICPVGYTGDQCEIQPAHCTPNPCQNSAPCFNTQADYYCHCPENWEGKNCSTPRIQCNNPPCNTVDSCMVQTGNASSTSPGICGDHGVCVSLPEGGFKCNCDPGFTGKYCHENINDCKVNPCQNGGTCVDKVNSFQCICKEGWEGDICERNKNECSPSPCHNNGSCLDRMADFECICRDGWKGKTCNLKDSHCDHTTCRNGGTCQDLGDTYICHCTSDWEGTTCHIAKSSACKSNPCQNGATCVNAGDAYKCICKDGFEGKHCQHDINDCHPPPCYNGGKCVDGVNWFLCECAEGFTGPDCRINVNDCASNPCSFGSTCVDGIGEFRCICPPERTGLRCEHVADHLSALGECQWEGRKYTRNTTWLDECNTCICSSSGPVCTQIWCGLGNCLGQPNLTHGAVICQSNQVCVPTPREACLTPPCAPWGECRNLESGKRVGPPSLPAPPGCWPNQAVLSNTCARLTLLLDRSQLPQGVTVEGLCCDLRRLLAAGHAATITAAHSTPQLVLLCDLKQGYNDTIEVTLSSPSPYSGIEENRAVTEGIRVLGELISRKQTNLSALTSIVEVKVETALVSEEKPGNGYMIALICVIFAILCFAGVAGFFYWHHLLRRRQSGAGNNGGVMGNGSSCHHLHHHSHHDDEKSNNLQNEENLRRYANPLKDEGKAAGTVSSTGDGNTLDLPPRISVVRPLSAATLVSSDGPSEALEMVSDTDATEMASPGKAGSSSAASAGQSEQLQRTPRSASTHRNSQILLYKAQNPDVRKNTAATFDDVGTHKDFAKRIINLKTQPPVQRTLHSSQIDRSGDVLTVIV
ncbi:protein jagged-1b [Schistocerca serialis cubense]|uniref:protein jagged-1b n=1 Tax=Schistocerca serialis cubense TaxID=2023355 RepID=UPI00214F0332|nr:protein jagged-1b [Schistocerca serialis cubense]